MSCTLHASNFGELLRSFELPSSASESTRVTQLGSRVGAPSGREPQPLAPSIRNSSAYAVRKPLPAPD